MSPTHAGRTAAQTSPRCLTSAPPPLPGSRSAHVMRVAAAALLVLWIAYGQAWAKGKLQKDEFEFLAVISQRNIAHLQACANEHPSVPLYAVTADELDAKLLMLVGALGFSVEAFTEQHQRKVEAFRHLGMRRPDAELCDATLQNGLAQVKRLNARLVAAGVPMTSARTSCPLSADYYFERFHKTGKVADLTCAQRAGNRELQDAQSGR
jgi:hypothetical protein